jgi:hypothetical protein
MSHSYSDLLDELNLGNTNLDNLNNSNVFNLTSLSNWGNEGSFKFQQTKSLFKPKHFQKMAIIEAVTPKYNSELNYTLINHPHPKQLASTLLNFDRVFANKKAEEKPQCH